MKKWKNRENVKIFFKRIKSEALIFEHFCSSAEHELEMERIEVH